MIGALNNHAARRMGLSELSVDKRVQRQNHLPSGRFVNWLATAGNLGYPGLGGGAPVPLGPMNMATLVA